jgi:hypothetical protein
MQMYKRHQNSRLFRTRSSHWPIPAKVFGWQNTGVYLIGFWPCFLEIWRRLGQNRSLLYQTLSKIPHDTPPLPRNRVWCSVGLKRMYDCISVANMSMIKTLEGCACMPPTPKPIQFHVGILINEANYVTNTLSRQQSVIVENPPSVLLCTV